MLSLGPGELGLLLTIWMDDPLYTSCRNRFPIFHKISAISHMIFTNILPHIKSYKHHEIHLLFGKPPPRFDLTSCFILQVKDGKATATYSRKLACLAILHAVANVNLSAFFLLWHPHKTELSQVLTTLADVVWLISWSFVQLKGCFGSSDSDVQSDVQEPYSWMAELVQRVPILLQPWNDQRPLRPSLNHLNMSIPKVHTTPSI